MSRTTQRARSSFYQSRGTLRLTSVVTMLIVVGLLMYRASDPRNWVWLTGEPREESRITEVARQIKPQGDEQIAPGPTDLDQDEREAAKEQYQAITDHTQALGREEMPAYWRLFN